MYDKLIQCETEDNCQQYQNYDGWSMGAYMIFEYYNLDYTISIGACWQDGQCFGAWLGYLYNNGIPDYYSYEISF